MPALTEAQEAAVAEIEKVSAEQNGEEPPKIVQRFTFTWTVPGGADGDPNFEGPGVTPLQLIALAGFLDHLARFNLDQFQAAKLQQAFAEAQERAKIAQMIAQGGHQLGRRS